MLPNGNIIINDGKNLEIINQDFKVIKTCKIPMIDNKNADISKYSIFVSNTKVFISTSFKTTYIYDFELNPILDIINDYFMENTIIEIDNGKIIYLWYDEKDNYLGCYKYNEYSKDMSEKKEKKLKYKIQKIFKNNNNSYYIGLNGTCLIFFSTVDSKIVGYCQFKKRKQKVVIKDDKIFVLYNGEKIEVYSINQN